MGILLFFSGEGRKLAERVSLGQKELSVKVILCQKHESKNVPEQLPRLTGFAHNYSIMPTYVGQIILKRAMRLYS